MTARFDLSLSRREFLRAAAVGGGALLLPGGIAPLRATTALPGLRVDTRTIDVNGKAATVFSIVGPDGRQGLYAAEGDRFAYSVQNATTEPLALHWHGQALAPHDMDLARPGAEPLAPGEVGEAAFDLTPGTHWMHSHSLTEQQMLAAPMIAREKNAGDVQDVAIMLHDFAFRSPAEILRELGGGANASAHGGMTRHGTSGKSMGGHHMGGHGMSMGGHNMPMGGHNMPMMGAGMGMAHANDVTYDAYLANDRTLNDPEMVRVDKGGRVRLRIINGGTATAFFISAEGLSATCIAVDGMPCQPVQAPRYPLAQGQRIDLLVDIPKEGGAFPILAQVEAAQARTGVILSTAGAVVSRLKGEADQPAGYADLSFEASLRAASPLAKRKADRSFMLMLGEEPGYRWTINGKAHGEQETLDAKTGERVELTFMNPTMMMHPMHLHGHHFQVVGLGGKRVSGPVRDTVIVPPHFPVTVAFDARLKGDWYLHCHHLYHMAAGMMTELRIS